jgi:hypothetical protein
LRSPSKITGIIFDATTYRLNRVFEEIGVTEVEDHVDNGLALLPATHYPEFEWKDIMLREDQADQVDDDDDDDGDDGDDYGADDEGGDENANSHDDQLTYHTWGSLEDVAQLRTQKRTCLVEDYTRVVGVQIVHSDGTVDTLGQWNPEDVDTIAEIYDHALDGPLLSVDFIASEDLDFIAGIAINIVGGSLPVVPRVTVCADVRRGRGVNLEVKVKKWDVSPDKVKKMTMNLSKRG